MVTPNVRVVGGLLLVIMAISAGCGDGSGRKWEKLEKKAGGSAGDTTSVKAAFCPKGGGELRFLSFDSLKMVGSKLQAPPQAFFIGNVSSPFRIAILTSKGLYLLPPEDSLPAKNLTFPELTDDLQVAVRETGVWVLDRAAMRLVGVDFRRGVVDMDRTFFDRPEDIHYYPSKKKIALVSTKGNRSVVSVLSIGNGRSISTDLESIAASASVEPTGRIYLATLGISGETSTRDTQAAKLVAYQIDDLTLSLDIPLNEVPGDLVYAKGSDKLYIHFPAAGLLKAIDPSDGKVLSEIPLDEEGSGRLYIDEAGRYVYHIMERTGHLSIVSTETDLVVGEIESQNSQIRLLATPNSRYFFLQDNKGSRIRLYDGVNFQLLRVFMESTPMTIGLVKEMADISKTDVVDADQAETPEPEPSASPDVLEAPPTGEKPEHFTIQVFSSNVFGSSKVVKEKLINLGFPASIEDTEIPGKGTWYRVKVGEFSSWEDANAFGKRVREASGLEYWVTSLSRED